MTTETVTVRGVASVPAEPDQVEISLAVEAFEPVADAALAEATRRTQALVELFEELGIERRSRSTTGVSINEEREYDEQGSTPRGYRAMNQLVVRLRSADELGRLMRESVQRTGATIHGPRWLVAPDNPARTEASRRAATEARRKAEVYAEALGKRIGEVIAISEPGVAGGEHGAVLLSRAAMAADVPMETGGLEVWAAVDVTFQLQKR